MKVDKRFRKEWEKYKKIIMLWSYGRAIVGLGLGVLLYSYLKGSEWLLIIVGLAMIIVSYTPWFRRKVMK